MVVLDKHDARSFKRSLAMNRKRPPGLPLRHCEHKKHYRLVASHNISVNTANMIDGPSCRRCSSLSLLDILHRRLLGLAIRILRRSVRCVRTLFGLTLSLLAFSRFALGSALSGLLRVLLALFRALAADDSCIESGMREARDREPMSSRSANHTKRGYTREYDMNLLLLVAVRVVELDREALAALPAVRAGRERARDERRGPDEARVGRREAHRPVVGEHGWSVGYVDVEGERARLERRGGEVGL